MVGALWVLAQKGTPQQPPTHPPPTARQQLQTGEQVTVTNTNSSANTGRFTPPTCPHAQVDVEHLRYVAALLLLLLLTTTTIITTTDY